jgi:protein FRA10AC1
MPPPNHAWAAASSSGDKLHSQKVFSQSSASTSAYTRHLQATEAYLRYYGGSIPAPVRARSERDILEENHQFIREDDDEVDDKDEEKAIARRYYEKLFKEFAVVELARWREKQVRSMDSPHT